ncbi:MAG: hypothetical protein RLY35_1217 [Bacteroidota bacterium]|jgi:RNA polymerase sigma-54 factor
MLKQNLQLKLQQKLSPQQIQLMKLLQVTTMDLEQRIKEELQDNPALEEGNDDSENDNQEELDQEEPLENDNDDLDINLEDYFDEDSPDYKTQVNNQGKDIEERQTPIGQGSSFQDLLYQQLHFLELNEEELMIADYLIGNLDDDGYLRRDLASIGNDLLFAQGLTCELQQLEEALRQIQSLDPPGIGARNLQECLLIQIKRAEKKDETNKTAQTIVTKYFEEFTKKHFEKIAQRLNQSLDDIKPAIDLILHLNPKPGNSGSDTNKEVPHITPDFLLSNDNDELKLSLNGKNAPDLRISPQYKEMLSHYSKVGKKDKSQKEAIQFVKQKIDSAKWFIDAILQRNQTLLVCMEAIIEHQRAFFLDGDEAKLKPMILKDIADRVNMDISTISRMANSKYIQTPFGTYLLKYFFSEGLSTDDGEEASSREIKQILKDAIEQEPKRKPLPDEKLMEILNQKGYNIARRTVAKYREQLGIPVARLRKEL